MDERPRERTWLCSVVFVDIVHYSVQSVTLEINWKARLNRYLAESIQDVPEGDRVILDTGDGAAVCFLGDPEAAMFCALRLLDSFVKHETGPVGMRVRIGVNVGPVKLVRDINANLNAVGDGINVGQRVMSFAAENQILVSRSFYEVASRLSDSYAGLFRYVGVNKDKHVREHQLYELLPPGTAPVAPSRAGSGQRPAPQAPPPARPPSGQAPAATAARSSLATPSSLDPVTAERIERHLAQVVGPIARFLVRDAGERAPTPAEALRALARYVPGPEAQARFLSEAGAELGLAPEEPPPAEPAQGPARTRPSSTPPHVPAAGLDPAVLERVTRELAAHVGPVARVIVRRTAPGAPGEAELYAALAVHVPDGPEREAFLAGSLTGGTEPRPHRDARDGGR